MGRGPCTIETAARRAVITWFFVFFFFSAALYLLPLVVEFVDINSSRTQLERLKRNRVAFSHCAGNTAASLPRSYESSGPCIRLLLKPGKKGDVAALISSL